MEKYKVLIINHAYILETNRRIPESLSEKDEFNITILAPHIWREKDQNLVRVFEDNTKPSLNLK